MRTGNALAEALNRIGKARAAQETVLDLGDLELDTLPEELGNLPALRVLALGQMSVHQEDGNLTWKFQVRRPNQRFTEVSVLAGLTNLRTLDLDGCDGLTDVSGLAGLTNLQELSLNGCDGLTEVNALAGLTNLLKLDLEWCKSLTDVSALAHLTNLQELSLDGCDGLTEVNALAGLTNLRTLDLVGCNGLADVSGLAGLTNLQKLDLGGCNGLADVSGLAGLTNLQKLDLQWWHNLTDVSGLAGLTNLRTLSLERCRDLTDVSALAHLTNLQELSLDGCDSLTEVNALAGLTNLRTLDLGGCDGLTDVSGLAGLTNLRKLNLSKCSSLHCFAPLCPLLRQLNWLGLYQCCFDDLPVQVYGEARNEDVLGAVRAHCADAAHGVQADEEMKVFILGNGGVGKTQLCRRLRGEPFDPSEPPTPGIQTEPINIRLPGRAAPVRLNLWDFGGQDIYHGSHTLFLQGPAVFVLVWTPETEHGEYQEAGEGGVRMRHRPLAYWLEYILSLAGTESPVLIVQGKCDRDQDKSPVPAPLPEDFTWLRCLEFSAKEDQGEKKLENLRAVLAQAAGQVLEHHPFPQIPVGRVRLAQQVRKLFKNDRKRSANQRLHRTLSQEAFRRLCEKNGQIEGSWQEALKFLHHRGVVFWRPELFKGRIILDQSWAIKAIYALFERTRTLPTLFGRGRFTREQLAAFVWQDRTEAEQWTFLDMMESCGICFRVRWLEGGECEYAAPELLPERQSPEVQSQLAGRIPDGRAPVRAEVRYPFLHEGVLRGFLSWLGGHAGDSAVYWRFGCWYCQPEGDVKVLIDSRWGDDPEQPWQGVVTFEAWGHKAVPLLKRLIYNLKSLSPTQIPKIEPEGFEAGEPAAGGDGEGKYPEADIVALVGKLGSIPSWLIRSRSSTLRKMLRLVELWQNWPTDEFNAEDFVDALSREKIETGSRNVSLWIAALEELCGKLTRGVLGQEHRHILPDARKRLATAAATIRAELDRRHGTT